jgi:hypothetical protein
MEKDTLRMQFLSGVITESEYKAIINKEIEDAKKDSLNESMIGGIVGIGAINQIPPRAKADYETAFEHFLGGKYGLNEVEIEEVKIEEGALMNEEYIVSIRTAYGTISDIEVSAENEEEAFDKAIDKVIDALQYAKLDQIERRSMEEGKKVKIEEGAFNDLLNKMESNTRMAADILTVITLAKEDKEGNAEKAVELLMKNHDLSEEAALEAVTRIFKKAFEWVDSMEEGKEVEEPTNY